MPVMILGGLLALVVSSQTGADKVSGTLFGKSFRPNYFTVKSISQATASDNGQVTDRADSYVLNLQVGDDFMPEVSVEIWWNSAVGKPLDGMKLDWKSTKFGTDAHSRQSFPVKGKSASVGRGITTVFLNSGKKHEVFSDQISCQMSLGKRSAGRIPVTVSLSLPGCTRFRGSFSARIEK